MLHPLLCLLNSKLLPLTHVFFSPGNNSSNEADHIGERNFILICPLGVYQPPPPPFPLPIKIINDSTDDSIVVKLTKRTFLYSDTSKPWFQSLLLSSLTSCQLLTNYIPKSKTKIHIHLFLLEILMDSRSSRGLMVTTAADRVIENLLSSPTHFGTDKF